MDLVVLALAFVVILIGAELFTNSIEWFGRKLELAEGVVGSVLAAVGTALPETMIPLIAILFGTSAAADEVGVGAILGAPFMLATLAMFVTGIAVLHSARRRPTGDVMLVDTHVLAHDMRYFAIAYAIAIGAAFLPLEPVWLKWIVALVLLGIYAWYVKGHFEADPDVDASDLSPLRFHRFDRGAHRADPVVPRLRIVNIQVLAALALIILGAVLFVEAVDHIANVLGVDELLLALVIAPIATELPEKANSVDLGPGEEGHARHGQHHRGHGLPVDDPDGRGAALRLARVGGDRRDLPGLRVGRDRLPLVGGDLHPDGEVRSSARQGAPRRWPLLSPLRRARDRRHHRGLRRGRVRPLLYSGDRFGPSRGVSAVLTLQEPDHRC